MAHELKVPSVGESITEVVISQWLKKPGEAVKVDEPVVSIDTDKVSTEVLSPVAGVLQEVRAAAGETKKVGEIIAIIGDGAASPASAVSAAAPTVKVAAVAAPAPAAKPAPVAAPAAAEPRVMPAAAREMATSGVALSAVTPTGPGGRVLKEDVQRAASPAASSAPAPAAAPAPHATPSGGARDEQVVRMTPMRKKIAERLIQAQSTAAMLTTFNEIDMQPCMDLRKQYQEAFVAKHGVKLGFMSLFVKAAVDALKLVPAVNAQIRGDDIVYHGYADIGVAVGGGKGLVVPILRNAERMSFADVEKAIGEFGKKAKENKLTLEDMAGGTFTITNGGIYGSLMSTPILNMPQSGILGMHNIVERPVAHNGQVVIRPMMYVALSYDHRIIDGREAVTFLKRIKECIESPERMLIEV
jgi:2-oxoglutarate dehydrogenase E2 component (dihydrolipoamide succinyltransferase)